ncbi:MAG: GNAT family N-acetyltransferase [Rhodospirillaceae bacterium]|nr:GNAT family N-acetyltransferase [Rhodospirillaceae bacterium]|tara:strand:+ start:1055 stop:1519 length:465 start_codon:yes stop_codon:yes gene_type:complete
MQLKIEVFAADPLQPEITKMIEELDILMQQLYPSDSNHLTAAAEFATGSNQFFVARIDEKIVGCGGILVSDADYAEVKRIYVAPKYRNLGVAPAILARLEKESRKLGLVEMKLETGILQPAAIRVFEKCGFSQSRSFGRYEEDDPYSYFMSKLL